jgi:ArsR family transcriptional regulator
LRHLDTLTAVYGALADATRLRILALLKDGEVCVCHIHASLGVPQPTASRHLAYLRRSGLVTARRSGSWMHYSLAALPDPVVSAVVTAALHALTHTDVAAKDAQRLHRELAAG